VTFTLTDLRRPSGMSKYAWFPFESDDSFTDRWWVKNTGYMASPWFARVTDPSGVEVARVEMDEKAMDTSYWPGAPRLGTELLEIQLLEVSQRCRRRRVGTEVVRLLEQRHPDRRLVALSEDADEFWSAVGWQGYEHSDGRSRPLFVQPEMPGGPAA
jgi:hypothetical protein